MMDENHMSNQDTRDEPLRPLSREEFEILRAGIRESRKAQGARAPLECEQQPGTEADQLGGTQSDPPRERREAAPQAEPDQLRNVLPKTGKSTPDPPPPKSSGAAAGRRKRSDIGLNGDHRVPQSPPISETGEKGVLCALLRAPGKTAKRCANRITAGMFFNPIYASLYELILEWPNPDSEVSLKWLEERLTAMGLLEDAGGRLGLEELYIFEPCADNAEFNIDLVLDAYRRRELIRQFGLFIDRCFDRSDELPAILETAKETIAKIGVDGSQRLGGLLEATLSGEEFDAIQIPPRTPIIKDWFMEGDLGFVYAFRGSGKTWFVLSLSSALATGSQCGPWQVLGEWPVLYIDGEMMSADIQERIRALNGGKVPANLHVLNHEILYHKKELVLNLGTPTDQQSVLQVCLKKKIRVLVLDNLGCLFSGIKENDAAEWEKVLPWLLDLRRHKIAVVIVHHTGVDATRMRGTTKREDPAAFLVRLDDKKEDFKEAGARFITRFRKYRGREAIFDHEWNFRPNGNEVVVTFKEALRADVVLQWVRDGLDSCSEIAREMGLSNGQVSKIATRLISEGKLTKNRRGYEVVEP